MCGVGFRLRLIALFAAWMLWTCINRQILVGQVVSMWGDGWLPVKIVNSTLAMVTLCRSAKIADEYSYVALHCKK